MAEPVSIPAASRVTVEAAVRAAIREGVVWLIAGPASLYKEDVPEGIISGIAILQAPPQPVKPQDILPPNLPEAWGHDTEVTTSRAIADALSTHLGKPLPWSVVRQAIDGAFTAHYLERTPDSGAWPCDAGGASTVRMRIPQSSGQYAYPRLTGTPAMPHPGLIAEPPPGTLVAEADLRPNEIQELADQIGDLTRLAAATETHLAFHLRIQMTSSQPSSPENVANFNTVLQKVASNLKVE